MVVNIRNVVPVHHFRIIEADAGFACNTDDVGPALGDDCSCRSFAQAVTTNTVAISEPAKRRDRNIVKMLLKPGFNIWPSLSMPDCRFPAFGPLARFLAADRAQFGRTSQSRTSRSTIVQSLAPTGPSGGLSGLWRSDRS